MHTPLISLPHTAPADTTRHTDIPVGRLVELVDGPQSAATTLAAATIAAAQRTGEPTAWVQPVGGPLYPPDLHALGVDVEALVTVHVPASTKGPAKRGRAGKPGTQRDAQLRAAEVLLRSGGFGVVVIDLRDLIQEPHRPPRVRVAIQGRLLGLARSHDARVLLLTGHPALPAAPTSLGPLVSLRIAPHRESPDAGGLASSRDVQLVHHVLKNKLGAVDIPPRALALPWGIGGPRAR